MISINNDFIDKNTCDLLKNYAEDLTKTARWDRSDLGSGWNDRYVHAGDLVRPDRGFAGTKDIEASNILLGIREKVKQHIIKIRNLQIPLYSDMLQLVRWVPGNQQHPHADSQNEDGSTHPYYWREYASILYLNSDYTGGSIYFPQHDIELTPSPGTMVTFPGTVEYMHGVRAVTSGERYTVASFWTTDILKADHLSV